MADAVVVVTQPVQAALRLATREAVNQVALLITQDARRRVQAAIGAEQRMSGVTSRQRNGKRSQVTPETIAKGGTRINPAYKNADSLTNPVAVIGARGPAHYIEHPRRGGYEVRPRRAGATGPAVPSMAAILAKTLDITPQVAEGRLRHPALRIPGTKGRASAHPGPINHPLAPITQAFTAAPTTMANAARDELEAGLRRRLGRLR
jgi:hypothetical protein